MTPQEWLILRELQEIKRRQSWWLDLGSNVAGNAIFDGAVWALRQLIKKL